jgi:hypothetical protein
MGEMIRGGSSSTGRSNGQVISMDDLSDAGAACTCGGALVSLAGCCRRAAFSTGRGGGVVVRSFLSPKHIVTVGGNWSG